MKVPSRWLAYSKFGAQVQGTRMIPFRTPLRQSYRTSEDERWQVDDLIRQIPRLGIVIDLTFSTLYYDPLDVESKGIVHKKIKCQGHQVPNPSVISQFTRLVDDFLAQNSNNGKLVGVHCTHGLNRTGFLICRYMIDKMKFTPDAAIAAFEGARGHKMERDNYIAALRKGHSTHPSRIAPPTQSRDRRDEEPSYRDRRYDAPEDERPNTSRGERDYDFYRSPLNQLYGDDTQRPVQTYGLDRDLRSNSQSRSDYLGPHRRRDTFGPPTSKFYRKD